MKLLKFLKFKDTIEMSSSNKKTQKKHKGYKNKINITYYPSENYASVDIENIENDEAIKLLKRAIKQIKRMMKK